MWDLESISNDATDHFVRGIPECQELQELLEFLEILDQTEIRYCDYLYHLSFVLPSFPDSNNLCYYYVLFIADSPLPKHLWYVLYNTNLSI